MIDLAFQTADGPIRIEIAAPADRPKGGRPWSVEVRLDGRPSFIPGEDPLEALEMAAGFASSYLRGREGLNPPVHDLPYTQSPDLLAQGFREGLLAVLEARGIPCPDEARARVAACADLDVLRMSLANAKAAESIGEVFAAGLASSAGERCEGASDMIEITFHTADGPILIQLSAPVPRQDDKWPWAVEVRTDGRPLAMVGSDPLEALEMAARFASSYLSGREGLDPPVNTLPLTKAPDILAQGFREGILAVLEARGIPCPDEARAHIASCSDPAVLQRLLARAKTAASIDELLAAM